MASDITCLPFPEYERKREEYEIAEGKLQKAKKKNTHEDFLYVFFLLSNNTPVLEKKKKRRIVLRCDNIFDDLRILRREPEI